MAGARLCPAGDYKVLRSLFDKCALSVRLLQDPRSEGVAADDEVFTPRKRSLQQKTTLKYMPSASNRSNENGALRVRYAPIYLGGFRKMSSKTKKNNPNRGNSANVSTELHRFSLW